MGKRENTVEKFLKSEVKKIGGISRKWVSPQYNGVPDQIIIFKGQVYFVEVKTVDGEVTSVQEREHERLREHGAIVLIVVGKKGVEEFINALVHYS